MHCRPLLFSLFLLAPGLMAPAVPAAWAGTPPQRAAAAVAQARALLAEADGRDAEALELFAEARRLDPDDGGASHAQGLLLLRLGRSAEAAEALAASLAAPRPADVARDSIAADLARARAAEPRNDAIPPPVWQAASPIDDRGLWEGVFEAGPVADSNPTLLSDELILQRPDRPAELLDSSTSDRAGQVAVRLALHPFHQRTPRVGNGLSLGLSVERSYYQELDFLDFGQARGLVSWSRGSSPEGSLQGPWAPVRVPFGRSRFAFLVQGGASGSQLGGTRYAESFDAGASALWRAGPRTATRFDLVATDRTFSGRGLSNERQSGQELSLEVSQLAYFGRPDRFARLAIGGHGLAAGRAFAHDGWQATAELAWSLSPRLSANLTAAAARDSYRHAESNLFAFAGEPRRDRLRRAALALAWEAAPRLHLTLRAARGERRSNVDLGAGLPDLDYRRTTVATGLLWRWR